MNYAPGDLVVYCKQKNSTCPGPRAKKVWANPRGENYVYVVDKYWIVDKVDGEELTLLTRTGKANVVKADDENLRRAKWWEKFFLKERFPDDACR